MESDIVQNEDGERAVNRPVGVFTFEDIHRAVFGGKTPEPHSLEELKEGIPGYVRKRYARLIQKL